MSTQVQIPHIATDDRTATGHRIGGDSSESGRARRATRRAARRATARQVAAYPTTPNAATVLFPAPRQVF